MKKITTLCIACLISVFSLGAQVLTATKAQVSAPLDTVFLNLADYLRGQNSPALTAYFRDSLQVLEDRCSLCLKAAYMADTLIEVNYNVPGWEGFPVGLYQYLTGKDIKTGAPKLGKVYMLNPSAKKLAAWVATASWEAWGRLDRAATQKILNFITWQSGAQFPVSGVVYEDMYTAGFYEPYVFKDGVTVYVSDSTYVAWDKHCTPAQLEYYLHLNNDQIKERTGRYARICSTTREMYYASGGSINAGESDDNRSRSWLELVRHLYQKAWNSVRNELIIAWARSNSPE